MAAVPDFARKFDLVLKAFNLSRGRLAQTVGVDKSVVSRWASGTTVPTDHNLSLLTQAVARHKTDFGRRDWYLQVDAFAIRLGLAAGSVSQEPSAAPPLVERPAIAVLPFANMGGEAEQEYFTDGITEDIITALSKWRSFLVIARNSAFTYKGRNVDVRQVGHELGARYVLEGSVRKSANRVRITAQLIDAMNATHLWAERYDRDLTDVFAIQDEISGRIATMVEPELGRYEQKRSSATPPTNLQAWDCVHRGMHLLYKFTQTDIAAARPYFDRAIELDPTFSRAYAGLAYTHQLDLLHGYAADRPASIACLLSLARRSVELDDDDSYAHLMLAFAYRWVGEHDLAVAQARKAIEVNPSDAWALGVLGLMLDLAGQHLAGRDCFERSIALSPRDPHVKFCRVLGARGLVAERDYANAEIWARKAIETDPSQGRPHLVLASALAHAGRTKEARAEIDACERLQPGFAAKWVEVREYRSIEAHDHVMDGLRKAGMTVK